MRVLEEDKLGQYIKAGNYEKTTTILRQILIEIFEKKIKEKNKKYVYTDMINLINAGKMYLDDDIKHLPMYIDDFSDNETDYIDDLNRMLSIYGRIKK